MPGRMSGVLSSEALSPEDLRALDSYKYSGSDLSLCSKYFMQAYWSAVVELVPKTVAPNMLTLLGFIASSSTSFLLLGFALAGVPTPDWVWAYAGVALFAYQTLDAIDGKQARRTGCGSPMGELFDHGCDALFTPVLCVTTCLAIGLTPVEGFLYCFFVNSALFFSLYEQFCTGTLDLGYINGPVEGVLLSAGVLISCGVLGPSWWAAPFATPLVDLGVTVLGAPLAIRHPKDILILTALASSSLTAVTNVAHALMRPKAHAKIGRWSTLLPHVLLAALVLYVGLSTPAVLQGPFPFALELGYGWIVSHTVTRMTIARLCHRRYYPFSMPYRVALGVALVAVGYKLLSPRPASAGAIGAGFAAVAVVTLAAYAVMVWVVFRQIARYLGINILTQTEKQLARNRKA